MTLKSLIIALVLTTTSLSFAGLKIEEELYVLGSPAAIQDMVRAGSVDLDHVSSQGFEAYGRKGLRTHLEARGLIVMDKFSTNKLFDIGYPSHKEMTATLQSLVAKYSKIMTMESIGKSVKGKDLWVVKISNDPSKDQLKPEVKYISSMHGDEITGREMMVMLISEIGEKYGKDKEITNLVDTTEIFIMPSMNPDGSESKKRANANGEDLNRNFPDILSDTESSPVSRQIEVQHIMKFQANHKFSLSANFHGGSVVMNYPWDSKKERHPLDALVQEISLGYSILNRPMYDSREFDHGIVNGSDWYIVRGGMQDWSYNWFNDLQITVEISDPKWPMYARMGEYYQDNRDSLIYFLGKVHQGGGISFSKKNVSGSVKVVQTSPKSIDLGSYAFSGSEFYKVLPEGTYEFTVSPQGAEKQVVNVVVTSEISNNKFVKVKSKSLKKQ